MINKKIRFSSLMVKQSFDYVQPSFFEQERFTPTNTLTFKTFSLFIGHNRRVTSFQVPCQETFTEKIGPLIPITSCEQYKSWFAASSKSILMKTVSFIPLLWHVVSTRPAKTPSPSPLPRLAVNMTIFLLFVPSRNQGSSRRGNSIGDGMLKKF